MGEGARGAVVPDRGTHVPRAGRCEASPSPRFPWRVAGDAPRGVPPESPRRICGAVQGPPLKGAEPPSAPPSLRSASPTPCRSLVHARRVRPATTPHFGRMCCWYRHLELNQVAPLARRTRSAATAGPSLKGAEPPSAPPSLRSASPTPCRSLVHEQARRRRRRPALRTNVCWYRHLELNQVAPLARGLARRRPRGPLSRGPSPLTAPSRRSAPRRLPPVGPWFTIRPRLSATIAASNGLVVGTGTWN